MQLLRALGWIFIPYVMVLAEWRRLNSYGKAAGSIWGLLVFIPILKTAIGISVGMTQPNQNVSHLAPSATTTENTSNATKKNSRPLTQNTIDNTSQNSAKKSDQNAVSSVPSQPSSHPGLGQTVQVGAYLITFPKTVSNQMMRPQHNILEFYDPSPLPFLFVQVNVKNASETPQLIGAKWFRLTLTPPGAETLYFDPDMTESINFRAAIASSNNVEYFADPNAHIIQPGVTDRLDLVYSFVPMQPPVTPGMMGIQFADTQHNTQQFDLEWVK